MEIEIGDKISLKLAIQFLEEYKVPLMMKFEVQGTNKDIIEFKDKVGNFNENHGRKEIQSY